MLNIIILSKSISIQADFNWEFKYNPLVEFVDRDLL